MSVAFEMLVSQPAILALVVVGVCIALSATALAARSVRRLDAQSRHLLELARAGRADEARIQARQASRDIAPMLAALGGELAAPPARSAVVRDLMAVVAVTVCPLLVVGAAWHASLRGDPADRIAGLSASLAALAVLLPSAMIAATLVVTSGRRGARLVRSAAVQVLSRSVRTTADVELSDGLRRSGHRDPRGD